MKPSKILVKYGRTSNLGDYESERLDASIEMQYQDDENPNMKEVIKDIRKLKSQLKKEIENNRE